MSFLIKNGIPEGDLPVKKPSGAARVRYVEDGKSYSSAMPDVIAASALVQDAIDVIVAGAESEISAIVNGLGYLPPVAFTSGLNVDSSRFTVTYSGVTYAPVADAVPFTTTGTFNPAQWRVIQGVTADQLNEATASSGLGTRIAALGAVKRTIAAKLADTVSVKDFGAVGDDIADDTAAFQAAVDAAPPYSAIYIPSGKYRLTSEIEWGNKAISVYGSGPVTTIVRGIGCGCFRVANTAPPTLGESYTVTFRDIWFTTDNSSDGSNVAAILVEQPAPGDDGGQTQVSVFVENCHFVGMFPFDQWWPYGVRLINAPNAFIDKCFYQGQANRCRGDAYHASGKSDVLVVRDSQAIFCNSGVTQESSDLENYGSEGLIVKGTGIDDCNYGVRKVHQNSSGVGEPLIEVIGCQISTRGIGIYTVNAYDISVHDCLIYMQGSALEPIIATPTGIHLGATPGASMKGFTVSQCGISLLDIPTGSGTGIYTAVSGGSVSNSRFSGINGPAIHVDSADVFVSRTNTFSNCPSPLLNSSGGARTEAAVAPAPPAGFPASAGYGVELAANPYFTSGSGWTLSSGWTIADGKASHVSGVASGISCSASLLAGATYRIEVTVSNYTSGVGVVGFTGGASAVRAIPNGTGTHVVYVTANSGNNAIYFEAEASGVLSISSLTVRQVLG